MIKIVLENLPLFVYEISLTRPFSKATFTNLFYYFPILSYEALKCIVSRTLISIIEAFEISISRRRKFCYLNRIIRLF